MVETFKDAVEYFKELESQSYHMSFDEAKDIAACVQEYERQEKAKIECMAYITKIEEKDSGWLPPNCPFRLADIAKHAYNLLNADYK